MWLYGRIEKNNLKWQTHQLSLAGKIQVVQKVLASHNINFFLTWSFSYYQMNKIDKILRDYLWFDGIGNKKRH